MSAVDVVTQAATGEFDVGEMAKNWMYGKAKQMTTSAANKATKAKSAAAGTSQQKKAQSQQQSQSSSGSQSPQQPFGDFSKALEYYMQQTQKRSEERKTRVLKVVQSALSSDIGKTVIAASIAGTAGVAVKGVLDKNDIDLGETIKEGVSNVIRKIKQVNVEDAEYNPEASDGYSKNGHQEEEVKVAGYDGVDTTVYSDVIPDVKTDTPAEPVSTPEASQAAPAAGVTEPAASAVPDWQTAAVSGMTEGLDMSGGLVPGIELS